MDNLLHFLNSADIDTLTKIPGMSRLTAESIIAARPYDSVEDCLKVKGMGKNLLARVQAAVEAGEAEPKHDALIPVEEPVKAIEIRQPMPETADAAKPSFGSRLGNVLLVYVRALLRLILFVMVMGGIVAAVYFGLPVLRERYIAPVEQNSARVSRLETEVANLKNQSNEINSHVDEIGIQVGGINQRVDDLDAAIQAFTASLEKLESIQATLEEQLKENNDKALLELKRQAMMTRALDMLTRARLYLAQSNFGLAKVDVQSARDLLAELQADTQEDVLAQAVARLDLALGNLPDFPVVASGDLEIAWQILMSGEAPPSATLEPTPIASQTSTPQPTLEATVTSTP